MAKLPDIQKLISFHKFLLEFQAIDREVLVPGSKTRFENDVEHSYHLAMMCWFLADHFPELDKNKMIRVSMVHDMVEVHAGDTFAFADAELLASKESREAEALKQLKKDWPELSDMYAAIEDYKHKTSREAQFVYALDKLMPMILHYLGEGEAFHQKGITLDMIRAEKGKKISKDTPIYDYYTQILALIEADPDRYLASNSGKQG